MALESANLHVTGRPLVVGGVGNRNLPQNHEGIEESIDAAFRMVTELTNRGFGEIVLLVSLAEGGDRLLIASARRLGIPYRCVLPASPELFIEDFSSPESVAEFEEMLSGADAVSTPEITPTRAAGYLWASSAILEQADVLLAIWDGSPGNGPAGTAHSVEDAIARSTPVLWISTSEPYDPIWLDSSTSAMSLLGTRWTTVST